MGDHYRTLGLARDASKTDVKNAFFRLAHRYHPDHHHSQADAAGRAESARRFREAKEAYDVLSHDCRRAEYDRQFRRSSYYSSSGYRHGGSSSSSSSSGYTYGGSSSSSSSSSSSGYTYSGSSSSSSSSSSGYTYGGSSSSSSTSSGNIAIGTEVLPPPRRLRVPIGEAVSTRRRLRIITGIGTAVAPQARL
jgi:DnaJ-class molecular chaperone